MKASEEKINIIINYYKKELEGACLTENVPAQIFYRGVIQGLSTAKNSIKLTKGAVELAFKAPEV